MKIFSSLAEATDVAGENYEEEKEEEQEEEEEEGDELAYPDTVIQLQHVGGDK